MTVSDIMYNHMQPIPSMGGLCIYLYEWLMFYGNFHVGFQYTIVPWMRHGQPDLWLNVSDPKES